MFANTYVMLLATLFDSLILILFINLLVFNLFANAKWNYINLGMHYKTTREKRRQFLRCLAALFYCAIPVCRLARAQACQMQNVQNGALKFILLQFTDEKLLSTATKTF